MNKTTYLSNPALVLSIPNRPFLSENKWHPRQVSNLFSAMTGLPESTDHHLFYQDDSYIRWLAFSRIVSTWNKLTFDHLCRGLSASRDSNNMWQGMIGFANSLGFVRKEGIYIFWVFKFDYVDYPFVGFSTIRQRAYALKNRKDAFDAKTA